MKFTVKAVVVLLLTLASAHASPTFYWGSNGGLDLSQSADVFDRFGSLVPQNSDWLVELVDISDDSVLFSLNDGFLDGDGYFYADVQDAGPTGLDLNGKTVKTVIYDAAIKGNALYFAEFTQQYSFSWGDPQPPALPDYNAGVVNSGQWQAIPEPAIAGLIVVFGGGMLAGRRIFKKG